MSQGFPEEARWLQSDAQILGRLTSEPHSEGVLLTLAMPWGEDYQAVVEKLNASSMTEFCELARGEYGEWTAKQDVKASSKRFNSREPDAVQEDVQGTQDTVAFDPLDVSSIQARYDATRNQFLKLVAQKARVKSDLELLTRILEVLNGTSPAETELSSVSSSAEGSGESADMAPDTRPSEFITGGAKDIGTDD